MTHKVTKRMSAENVPLLLTYWLEDGGLPYDITVKQRKCHGLRLVVFTITGSTKEDVGQMRGPGHDHCEAGRRCGVMARFSIQHGKRSPNWVLSLLVSFPFDAGQDYPDEERSAMLGTVLEYVRKFPYLRRNAWHYVGGTHSITSTESSIIISTPNGVPQLTISLT